jgi:hypothetical protein
MFDETKVREQIADLTETEQVGIWNEYCEMVNCFDDKILENDLDELLVGMTPSEVWRSISNDYRETDDYCTFNGYGMLESYSYLEYSPFDEDALVNWIVDNEDTLGYFSDYDVEVEEEEEEEGGDE